MRVATHAGSWYSNSSGALESEIKSSFQGLTNAAYKTLKYIIAPHAGYAYSLKTAAHAYSQIDSASYKTIFVLGPSHHFFLRGCAVDRFSSLQTPLGPLQVDVDIVDKLSNLKGFSVINNEASEDEHSIEMHLPLLRFVFKKEPVKVVPIMVGDFSESLADELTSALVPYFNDERTLFVFSSDFCHFGSRFQFSITGYESENKPLYEKIEMLDKRGIDLIVNHKHDDFLWYLTETENTICGRNPILLLLRLLAASNLNVTSRLLHYSQSSRITRVSDSSVSYAAIVGLVQN
ncbi:Memo-like family protein [Theileria parva strain Muguga]|uniref:Memo-like protein n=1 Tax=Theileria parva TaxID=5875 RepID=Q4N223_THEPA|nr:Memo-like family protein [Theileria parva strain Muguga]EAN31902.1 Memo-like family protein [Theileria parva strain Muguga]|eukprot:XP_764185.1 hypothetical protein [Theileria parva strain Muguga]